MVSRMLLLALIVFSVAGSKAAPAAQPPAPTQVCDTRTTINGSCCVFPFIYHGDKYYDCTKKNFGKEWCATTDNYDKNSDKWGQCGKEPKPIFDLILESNNRSSTSMARFSAGVELFEGDIVVDAGIRNFLNSSGSGRTKRAVMSNDRQRWMINGKGVVHYQIERSNIRARGVIMRAMRHWTSKVPCITFKNSRGRGKYLSFFNGGGCYSLVGRQGGHGPQRVSIGQYCMHMGVVAHEIGHALGFWHEQSRPDRDNYVRINWQNIQPNMRYNFKKQPSHEINSRGVPYDLNSLMHYGSRAFLMRGRTGYTIIGKDGRTRLGQRYGLSASDALQANRMYCGRGPRPPTRPPPPPTPPPPGCRFQDKHRWCPYWGSKGYCSKHASYMRQNCPKTCYCKNTGCSDIKRTQCPAWASRGYCSDTKYGPYTRVYCKKSCKVC